MADSDKKSKQTKLKPRFQAMKQALLYRNASQHLNRQLPHRWRVTTDPESTQIEPRSLATDTTTITVARPYRLGGACA